MTKLPNNVKHCPDCGAYYTIDYPHVCPPFMKAKNFKELDKELDKLVEGGLKKLKPEVSKPRFCFAVVWQDKTGQTVHLFLRKSEAENFYNQIK